MSTTVKYNGSTIATLTNQKKKLDTNQKWLTNDIEIEDITYGIGNVTQDSNGYLIFDDDAYLERSYGVNEILDGTAPVGDVVITGTKIAEYGFYGRNKMTSLTIVNNIPSANQGLYGFAKCTGLKTVDAPNLTSLKNKMFLNCSNLISINLPKLTTIEGDQVIENTKIPTLVLPSFTGTIYNNSLRTNTSLTAVDLKSATKLNATCFSGCSSLTTLVIRGDSVPILDNINSFQNTPFATGKAGGTLYVPNNKITAYQEATNWSTILGYETNSIVAIEGSQYENNYVDGTLITS